MPKFLIHETLTCEVTFVRSLTATSFEEAHDMAMDADGDLLGVSIGDTVAGVERVEIFHDDGDDLNIPAHFYKEPD